MADLTYRTEPINLGRGRTDWGAVWAGTFIFVAIWSIFGLLGEAIFATAANPNAAHPVTGMTVGEGIWGVVLTIIAFYVAGRITGRLAGVTNKHDGLLHGFTMFGLSVVSAIVIVVLAGTSLSGGNGVQGGVHSPYMLTAFADLGWIGFVALFLGWIAALVGGSQGVAERAEASPANVRGIRPAA